MERKKKTDLEKLRKKYNDELDQDVEYSLMVDPTGKLNLNEEQVKLIEYYIQTKNIDIAASMAELDPKESLKFILRYDIQQEIRRINMAICHRQFTSKMATLEEIGSYLTSLISGQYSPVSELLSTDEKLKASKMIIEVNKLINEGLNNPGELLDKDIDVDLQSLSVSTIRKMLDNLDEKRDFNIPMNHLSPEEIVNLRNQSKEMLEILKIIDNDKKKKK